MAIRLSLDDEGIDYDDEEEQEVEWKSKNDRKHESIRASQMARLLVTFTRRQIEYAVKFGFLPEQTLHATLMAQQMKIEGLSAPKARQYKYIASLIRKSEINLVEFVCNSLRDGPAHNLRKVMESLTRTERDKQVKLAAERWLQGLLRGDKSIVDEVYALPTKYFDKSRLEKLIRDVQTQVSRKNRMPQRDPLHGFMRRNLLKARRALTTFLEETAVYDMSARLALPKLDSSKLEELEACQNMEAEAFLSQTACQYLEAATLVQETGCQVGEANFMVEQAVQQEREALSMERDTKRYQEPEPISWSLSFPLRGKPRKTHRQRTPQQKHVVYKEFEPYQRPISSSPPNMRSTPACGNNT